MNALIIIVVLALVVAAIAWRRKRQVNHNEPERFFNAVSGGPCSVEECRTIGEEDSSGDMGKVHLNFSAILLTRGELARMQKLAGNGDRVSVDNSREAFDVSFAVMMRGDGPREVGVDFLVGIVMTDEHAENVILGALVLGMSSEQYLLDRLRDKLRSVELDSAERERLFNEVLERSKSKAE